MQGIIAFLSVTAAIFIAELGDKTQLFVMGLSAKEKPANVIAGMGVSIIFLNIMAVYLGVTLSGFMKPELVKLSAGFAFLVFAYLSLTDEGEEEEERKAGKLAILSIALMFFVAELGDKTQLSVIALAAREPEQRLAIFAGATVGMLLADATGVIIGPKIARKVPKKIISKMAFLIFAIFGIASVGESIDLFFPGKASLPTLVIAGAYSVLVFAGRRKTVKS